MIFLCVCVSVCLMCRACSARARQVRANLAFFCLHPYSKMHGDRGQESAGSVLLSPAARPDGALRVSMCVWRGRGREGSPDRHPAGTRSGDAGLPPRSLLGRARHGRSGHLPLTWLAGGAGRLGWRSGRPRWVSLRVVSLPQTGSGRQTGGTGHTHTEKIQGKPRCPSDSRTIINQSYGRTNA